MIQLRINKKINAKINRKPEKSNTNLCDFNYLIEITGGKKKLIIEIIDLFLQQVPEELESITKAIIIVDYGVIKSFTHTMKTSVSVMGITMLKPILQEMNDLSGTSKGIRKIEMLNMELNLICAQVINELEKEKLNYA